MTEIIKNSELIKKKKTRNKQKHQTMKLETFSWGQSIVYCTCCSHISGDGIVLRVYPLLYIKKEFSKIPGRASKWGYTYLHILDLIEIPAKDFLGVSCHICTINQTPHWPCDISPFLPLLLWLIVVNGSWHQSFKQYHQNLPKVPTVLLIPT